MSYYLCKRISLNEKKNTIKVCVADSSLRPVSYSTCELCKGDDYTFEEKLLHLFYDLKSGNIQIHAINENTEKFGYAMCKVREWLKENNIDSYEDLFEKKIKVFKNYVYDFAKIERCNDLSIKESEREYQDGKKYREWAEKQNKDDVRKMESEFSKKALKEVYGESFKIFKKALNEKFDGFYKVLYNELYPIVKLGKYNRGYEKFNYGSSRYEKFSFQKAYIVKSDFKNMNLKIIKIEG